MTIETYNYNDEPSGRSETLVQAIEKIERLQKENNDLQNEIKCLYDREEILIKKLNIALDCVLSYSDRKEWKSTEDGESCDFGYYGYELAEEALDKIKEVGMINEVKFKPFSSRLLEQKIRECDLLEKQLDVAVEALKYIYDDTKKGHTQCDACGYCSSCETCINADWAEKALKQIKELEKCLKMI